MVSIFWFFEVPVEKQAQYLKITIEKIKPFWESHGCQSYEIWQSAKGEPAFMKIMLFPDMQTMQKATGLVQSDPEARGVADLFTSFATNTSRRIYVKKT